MDKLPTQLNITQLKSVIDSLKSQNAPQDTIQNFVNNYSKTPTGDYVLKNSQSINDSTKPKTETDPLTGQPLEGKNIQSVKNAFNSGIEQTKTGYQEAKTAAESGNLLGLFEGSVKSAAGGFNAAFSPFAPVGDVINKTVIKPVSDAVSDVPAVQKFANSKAGENTSRITEDIANVNSIVGGVAGAMDIAPKIVPAVKNLATKATDTITNTIDKIKAPSALDETKIIDRYNRAIKPTVVGKSNAGQISKANDSVISGVKSIADNKANLTFTDANGETISGQSPKSVDQFTQAIEQTKKTIFKQYDALAKQAGGQGIKVDTVPIANELNSVIDSKSLSIANPSAVKYAEALQKRLVETGSLDAETAQQVIQHYNESLKAFYKNPSYETASNVQIDALIANKFREALDKGITGATGEAYGALKKQYGSLSAIEKDVAHRNIVWGRQNGVGLVGNLANLTSGAELIRGLITMNPADIAVSLGIKGIQKWIKYLTNPDVGVAKIFSEIEKPSLPAKVDTQAPVKLNKASDSLPKTITKSPAKVKRPNKQAGFIKIGTKTFKEIPEGTKAEMVNVIDYLRNGKEVPKIEDTLSRLARKYNIKQDWSNIKIANYFEDLVDKTKTS